MRELNRDASSPEGEASTALARRVSAVRWFERRHPGELRAQRLASALVDHTDGLHWPAPRRVRILIGPPGRHLLRECSAERAPRWSASLRRCVEAARVGSGRGPNEEHALLEFSDGAVLARSSVLPVDVQLLRRRLAGPSGDRLSNELTTILVHRIRWELSAAFLLALGASGPRPDPFEALLRIYEDGFHPLHMEPGGDAILWSPTTEPQ